MNYKLEILEKESLLFKDGKVMYRYVCNLCVNDKEKKIYVFYDKNDYQIKQVLTAELSVGSDMKTLRLKIIDVK